MNDLEKLEKEIISLVGIEKFKSGFERSKEYFERYKDFFSKRKVVTIAGTNGKGESSFYLEKILIESGIKTALWTSPHILNFNERIRINAQNVEVDSLKESFQKLKSDNHLSYYEFLFALFCEEITKRDEIEVIILEVGLGGRLDTVNVFDCDFCAITSISRDHVEILGPTEKHILLEKIAVSRKNTTMISAIEQGHLRNVAYSYASEHQFKLIDLYEEQLVSSEDHYRLRNLLLSSLLKELVLTSKIPDRSQILKVKEQLKPQNFSTLGRYQEMTLNGQRFIFIGAHNLDGIRKFCQYAAKFYSQDSSSIDLLISFSDRDAKEIRDCLKAIELSPCFYDEAYITSFNHPRAVSEEKLEKIVKQLGFGHFVNSWNEFCNSNDKEKTIMVVGSYYFISSIISTYS